MFLPGKLDAVKEISSVLKNRSIHFIVRKISPNIDQTNLLPFKELGNSNKKHVLFDKMTQTVNKMQWKKNSDIKRASQMEKFYDANEIEFLEFVNESPGWVNCGVWNEDGSYHELNSDYLVSNNTHRFLNWNCYAGVDSIYVDFDGAIYRGMCQNNGSIGHISGDIIFDNQPTICSLHWCVCNIDIPVRKSIRTDQANL